MVVINLTNMFFCRKEIIGICFYKKSHQSHFVVVALLAVVLSICYINLFYINNVLGTFCTAQCRFSSGGVWGYISYYYYISKSNHKPCYKSRVLHHKSRHPSSHNVPHTRPRVLESGNASHNGAPFHGSSTPLS